MLNPRFFFLLFLIASCTWVSVKAQKIIEVTSLEDNTSPGTLRSAMVEADQLPRNVLVQIIFRINVQKPVILLQSPLNPISKVNYTIDGHNQLANVNVTIQPLYSSSIPILRINPHEDDKGKGEIVLFNLILKGGSTGIAIQNASGVSIRNCHIYENDLGIDVQCKGNCIITSETTIEDNYFGLSPASVRNLPNVRPADAGEANNIGVRVNGIETRVNLQGNVIRYLTNGISIDTSIQNKISKNRFFKTTPAPQNERIPIFLTPTSRIPGNKNKAAPGIGNALYNTTTKELTLSGTGSPKDVIEVFLSDQFGNIIKYIGYTELASSRNWTLKISQADTIYNHCGINYFAATAMDQSENTSTFGYKQIANPRIIKPRLQYNECDGLTVQFRDPPSPRFNGLQYRFGIPNVLVPTTQYLPLNTSVSFTRNGIYPVQYTIIDTVRRCTFQLDTVVHVGPRFTPQYSITTDSAVKKLRATYSGSPITLPGSARFDYRWEARRQVNGQWVNYPQKIDKVNSTSQIGDYEIDILPGRLEIRLSLGNDLNNPRDLCTRSTGFQHVDLPFRVSINSKNATCGENGEIKIEAIGGVLPHQIRLNGVLQAESITGLAPGEYEILVNDNASQSYRQTIIIKDESPKILWLAIANGPCDQNNPKSLAVQFRVEKPVTTNQGSFSYEIIHAVTRSKLAEGNANYNSTVKTTLPNLVAGDFILLKLKDTNLNCELSSEALQITPPNLSLILDKSSYATCRNQKATVNAEISIQTNQLTEVPAITNYTFQLRKYNLQSRTYEANQGVINTSSRVQTFSNVDAGAYQLIATWDPNGYNCQTTTRYFTVRTPSALSASLVNVRQVRCKGQNNGSASVQTSNTTEVVVYKWFKRDEPQQILSVGPEASGLGPGSYQVQVWDENSCEQDVITLNFDITEPNALDNVQVRQVPDSCIMVATLPGGKGTAPYTFSWRDEGGHEKILDRNVQPFNGQVESRHSFSGIKSGQYYVFVIDANGCTAKSPLATYTAPEVDLDIDVCFRWVSPGVPAPNYNLEKPVRLGIESMADRAATAIKNQAAACVIEQKASLNALVENCKDPDFFKDSLALHYQLGYEHYTLYYYDRAGNLVKTVPPQGVDLGSSTRSQTPRHRLQSEYQYNNLQQLEKQRSPDGGETKFLYNAIGQLRFSQQARQAVVNAAEPQQRYAYNKYDKLGRVIEVGEGFIPLNSGFETYLNVKIRLEDILGFPTGNNLRDLTQTVYNTPVPSVRYLNVRTQRYLDNRISYARRINQNGDTATTYYSYDPHGNVEWLIQDLPEIGKQYLSYQYDLISGKVLQVRYNDGFPDRFYHRYQYDEENRLTQVETSQNGYIWDRDARYAYYAHGALRSVALGEDHLQKVDYTYTIHGWLKGINTPDLAPNAEEGPNKKFAQDAFGMALGYYNGDFRHQGSIFDAQDPRSLRLLSQQFPLYNGNIAAWSTHLGSDDPNVPPTLQNFSYTYDQLNRLRSSTLHRYSPNSGYTAVPDFATAYTYDRNGNFLTLQRKGDAALGLNMDDFTYRYKPNSNQLDWVNDAVKYPAGSDPYTLDIKAGQTAGNYAYDASGNLIFDRQEGLNFRWNSYGKLLEVVPIYSTDPNRQKPLIRFSYDAMGNRIKKEVNKQPYDATGKLQIIPEHLQTSYYINETGGNALAIYQRDNHFKNNNYWSTLQAKEFNLFGANRLGVSFADITIQDSIPFLPSSFRTLQYYKPLVQASLYERLLGKKGYELNDHLGNVRVVFGDGGVRKVDGDKTLKILERADYYPFGARMGNETNKYRYGFNGKEKDDEVNSIGVRYDFGERIYNNRIGRFLSIDPLENKYPNLTPYQFADNNPIYLIDRNGEEPNRSQAANWTRVKAILNNYFNQNAQNKSIHKLRYTEEDATGKKVGPFGGPKGSRYLYTEKYGWVDLGHFFQVASRTQAEMEKGEYGSVMTWLAKHSLEVYIFGRYKLWEKTEMVEESQSDDSDTKWSFEDGPSNLAGYHFWFEYQGNETLTEDLEKFFKEAGVTDPEQSSIWQTMPDSPQKKRWFEQNRSFFKQSNPVPTKDNKKVYKDQPQKEKKE